MDPLYEEIYDSQTGQTYLVDPLTGQLVTLTAADGAQKPAIGYNPAARDVGGRASVATENSAPTTVYSPPTRQAIDASTGQARPDLTPLLPTAPPTEQPATTGAASPSGGYGSGGYSRGGYGGYSRGGYSGGSGYDDYGTTPRYANNQRHPYFGGDPLSPGGVFAQQAQGYDNREQVTVPSTGASAGPYGVRAPDAPRSGSYGGGGGSGGGGGGGVARDVYWTFANKIKAKLTGAGQPASYEDYRQQTFRPYRGPEDPRTARRVERLDDRRANQAATYTHPEFAIPKGVNLESPLGQRMGALPGFDLTLLAGAGKKNWQGGIGPTPDIYTSYYKQLGKRLDAGKQGIDFFPYYRKELRKDKSLTHYNRTLQTIYDGVAQGRALDTGALFGNLGSPKKGTFLNQQFKNAPAGAAADQYLQSFDAILNSGEYGDIQQGALSQLARNATTSYGQRYAGRKDPRRIPSLNRYVARQIGGYFG